MLRLDPAHPPLWRDPETLQFGTPAVATAAAPEPWHARLIAELARGLPETGVDVWGEVNGVRRSDLRGFMDAIRPALLRRRSDAPPSPARHAVIRGGSDGAVGRAVRMGLELAGWTVADDAEGAPDGVVVLVGVHALDARSVRDLMARDRAHVPFVVTGHGVDVGPLILPGATACAVCIDLRRRDEDPAWPALLPQLLAATAPTPAGRDVLVAVDALIELLDEQAASPAPAGSARSVRVRGAVQSDHRWDPHPDCGCRVPSPVAASTQEPRRLSDPSTPRQARATSVDRGLPRSA